eukprot:688233-Amphidinium_carterae.2
MAKEADAQENGFPLSMPHWLRHARHCRVEAQSEYAACSTGMTLCVFIYSRLKLWVLNLSLFCGRLVLPQLDAMACLRKVDIPSRDAVDVHLSRNK